MVDHKVKLKHFDKGNMQFVVLYSNILNYFMHVLSSTVQYFLLTQSRNYFHNYHLMQVYLRMRKEILKMYANDDCSIEKLIINEFE